MRDVRGRDIIAEELSGRLLRLDMLWIGVGVVGVVHEQQTMFVIEGA